MTQSRRYQYFSAFGVSLATMATAIAQFWSAPILPKFINKEIDMNITDTEISWMVSVISPGSVVGSLAASFTSDKFGRRITLLGSAFPFIAGTIFILCATGPWILYVGRFLWGLSIGMISTVSSVYLSEIADKEIRGTLVVGTRIMFNFGATFVLIVGSFVTYQILCYVIIGIVMCYTFVCLGIAETPYFHLRRGRVYLARSDIMKLSGMKNGKEVDEKLTAMRAEVKRDMARSSSVKELFTSRRYRKAIIICAGLRITQVMSGSIPIQQYLGAIILESKINIQVTTALIVFGIGRFLVGFPSSFVIDKIGRRPMFIYSFIGAGILLAINGTYFFNKEAISQNENLSRYSTIIFAAMVLCKVISNLGFDILIFVIPGEIFPLNVRSTAMGVYSIFSAFVVFAAIRGYQVIKDISGLHGVFWFYSIMAFSGAVFCYYMLPETRGKSLTEIQMELQGDLFDDTTVELNTVVNADSGKDGNAKEGTELKEIKGEADGLLNR